MRFAYWITKARMQARSHNIWYLLFSPDNSGHAKASQYYVVHTLPVLFGRYLCVSITAKDLKPKQVRSLAKTFVLLNTFYCCPLICVSDGTGYLKTYCEWRTRFEYRLGNGLAWRILLPTATTHELRLNNTMKLSVAYYNQLISRLITQSFTSNLTFLFHLLNTFLSDIVNLFL